MEDELSRLAALGAVVQCDPVYRRDGSFDFLVLLDPVGTEFCLCAEHRS